MKKIISVCISLLLVVTISFSQTNHLVNAGSFYYSPSTLIIEAGDSVTFYNEGGNHDVVITNGPENLTLPECVGPCTIGKLKFNLVGEYEYICSIGYHASQGMVGSITVNPVSPKLALQGILDLYGSGSSIYTGDDGKAVHLKVLEDIADLSEYALSVANNGGGSDGPEYYLSGSVIAGDDILVYKVGSGSSSANFFADYFGDCYDQFEVKIATGQNFPDGNGDDPVELFHNDVVIDYYGDVDGSAISGDPYEDGWTYRNTDGSWLDGGKDCDVESNDMYSVLTSGCPYPICEEQPVSEKTFVPDDNFEAYLEANGMGDGIEDNDSVLNSNINSIAVLAIESYNISDLTGIEGFTSLTSLNCGENSLTSIDVSQNTALEVLAVYGNELTSIDVTNNVSLVGLDVEENQLTILNTESNPLLTTLFCSSNQLSSLDVSTNAFLEELIAYENQLTSMDISQNTSLIRVDFEINQLRCLNLKNGNNTNFVELWTQENPDLTCIEVDDENYSNANWLSNDEFYIGDNHYFSNNCNYLEGCALVGDTAVNCDSTILVYDSIVIEVYDTLYYNVYNYDTLTFNDTVTFYDTLVTCDSTIFNYENITVYDTSLTCDSVIYSYDTITYQDTLVTNIYNTITLQDTLVTTIYDTLIFQDTLITTIYDSIIFQDTTVATIYDTVMATIYDTVLTTFYDTSYITITVTDTLYIDVPVTNAGIIISNTIMVYPNPANDFVIIDNGDFNNMIDFHLEIVNAVGQVVFNSEINVQTFNIPVSSIGAAGLYFIHVKDSSNNTVITKHLILN